MAPYVQAQGGHFNEIFLWASQFVLCKFKVLLMALIVVFLPCKNVTHHYYHKPMVWQKSLIAVQIQLVPASCGTHHWHWLQCLWKEINKFCSIKRWMLARSQVKIIMSRCCVLVTMVNSLNSYLPQGTPSVNTRICNLERFNLYCARRGNIRICIKLEFLEQYLQKINF